MQRRSTINTSMTRHLAVSRRKPTKATSIREVEFYCRQAATFDRSTFTLPTIPPGSLHVSVRTILSRVWATGGPGSPPCCPMDSLLRSNLDPKGIQGLRGSLNDLPPGEQGRTILVLRPQCKLPCVSPKTTMRSAGRKLMTRAVLPPVFRSWYLPRATPAMKRRELDPSRFSSKDCRAHRVQARRSHAKSTPHIAGSHRLTRLNGSRLSSIPSLSCYTK